MLSVVCEGTRSGWHSRQLRETGGKQAGKRGEGMDRAAGAGRQGGAAGIGGGHPARDSGVREKILSPLSIRIGSSHLDKRGQVDG